MTNANSTSQSTLVPVFGMTRSSLGPTSAVVDLKKITGSVGIFAPVSWALSRKLRPMQTILLGRHTGGPSRALSGILGAELALVLSQVANRSRPPLAKKFSS